MFSVVLALSAVALAQDGPFAPAPDASRIEADVRALCGADAMATATGERHIESRHVLHPDHEAAAEWVVASYEAIDGLEVSTEAVEWHGEPGLYNVIAELPGAEPDLAPLVIGAHFDSTANLEDDWEWLYLADPAPGADDDASGVSASLEVARLLAAHEPGFRRTVRFVAFDAEEVGLVGSFQHVEGVVGRGEDVHLMIQMDPIGYNPAGQDRLWFSYDARFEDEAAALDLQAQAIDSPLEVAGVDEALIGGDERSDHFPFWEAGYPALHLGSFPQPPQYHTMDDDIDVVDFEFLTFVTSLVASHAGETAEPVVEEERRACGCAGIGAVGWVWLGVVPAVALTRRRRDGSRPRSAG